MKNQKLQQLLQLLLLSTQISSLLVLLHALLLNAQIAPPSAVSKKCSASTNYSTVCSSSKFNISFPFLTSDECQYNNSSFVISNCDPQKSEHPDWPGFTRYATKQSNPNSSFVMGMYTPPPSTATELPSANSSSDSFDRRYGYINLTWSTDLLVKGNNICISPADYEQISNYIPHSINLQGFARSAFNFDSSNIILLFSCNPTLVNSSSYSYMSNACIAYEKACSTENKDKSYNCYQYIIPNPSKELNLPQVMTSSGCKRFMFFVALDPSRRASTWKPGIIRLNWSSIGTDWLASTVRDCANCLSLNRSCGYSNSDNFECSCSTINCSNEKIPAPSPSPQSAVLPISSLGAPDVNPGSSKSKSNKIVIVVAGLLAVALFTALICFCKRKKAGTEASEHGNKAWMKRPSFLSRKQDPILVKEISYKELVRATETFAAKNILGDGGFGAVYRGVLADGLKVAVKRLHHDNYRRIEHFYNEIKVLSNLNHPNLVKLFGFCASEDEKELLLVFEYASQGTVSDHLHGGLKPPISWRVRLNIACETAHALAYLHNAVIPPIYHRDVKTANILLDDGFHVKLGDFGLSKLVPLKSSHISTSPQGTPGYLDPEYHECYQLTDKSDVYSLGVVLMELISGKLAVDMTRERGEINLSALAVMKIQCGLLEELVDPKLEMKKDPRVERSIKRVIELAFECLHACRDDRPSMKRVVETLSHIRTECEEAAMATEKEPPSSPPSIYFSSDTSCPSSNLSSS